MRHHRLRDVTSRFDGVTPAVTARRWREEVAAGGHVSEAHSTDDGDAHHVPRTAAGGSLESRQRVILQV